MTIDQAYQFVLFVANKEQRGSVPPEKFNMLAPIMQMSVINDAVGNIKKYQPHNPIPDYGVQMNRVMRRKLRNITTINTSLTNPSTGNFTVPSDFLYDLSLTEKTTAALFREVARDEYFILFASKIKAPTLSYPIYMLNGSTITVNPVESIPRLEYVKKPTDPKWNFTLVNNEPVYSASGSVEFALDETCHLEICMKILQAIGVNLKSEEIMMYAGLQEAKGS